MSRGCLRDQREPLQLLERLLNKTTLTSRRIGHENVEAIGGRAFVEANERARLDKEAAVEEAIRETQRKADERLQGELEKCQKAAEADKRRALEEARKEAEETASRVKRARDQLESERLAKLTWKLTNEKEEALREQWEKCERLKREAVAKAIADTTRRLKKEFALEKELAIASALKVAREKFREKLEKTVQRTIEDCEREAAEEAARVAKLHRAEVDRLNGIIQDLKRVIREEVEAREWVQVDFRDLQRDYKHFLNYTEGRYHADYLMRLRKHGMKYDQNWDQRDSEDVDIYPLPSLVNYHTKLGKVTPHDITKTMSFAPAKDTS